MKKNEYEELLSLAISTGADFAEIYVEDGKTTSYKVLDSKLDDIGFYTTRGIGIRLIKDNDYYYTSTNNLSIDNIKELIKNLTKNLTGTSTKKVKLNNLEEVYPKIEIPHNQYPVEKKKAYLLNMDKKIREVSQLISQVSLTFLEDDKEYIIANSDGKYIKSKNCVTRYICTVYAEDKDQKAEEMTDYAQGRGYEILNHDLESLSIKAANTAIEKLGAIDFKGGELPVVIAPGFGAVIFHEACGHGLEATRVAPRLSVFSNDLGKEIATPKVTLIDDGTIPNAWGSNLIDDEGNPTQKNILIEKGILKTFLVDKLHSKEMKLPANGCGRRENYQYAPTSRMSNTYLKPGTDKVEDMIKSIKLGVYCQKMSGGSVNSTTGDFNFAVDTARLIEDGKLTKMIKGITLIGNSKDILKNVEMVSSDLLLSGGYCEDKSGMIYITIGQPTIKVSKILVGGKE